MRRLLSITLLLLLLTVHAHAASWKSEGPFSGNITSMTVDPANPDRLWAATSGGGVWRSADGGKSWQLAGAELSSDVVDFIVLQPKSNTLWASVGQSLGRSNDGGKTWEWVMNGLAHMTHYPAFDPSNPKSIWLANVNQQKRSSDGGAKWTSFDISGGDIHTFTFHPTNSKIIWAGGTNLRTGLWKTIDGGISWRQIGKGLPEDNTVHGLVVDPADPDRLFMNGRGGFTSTDGGESWTPFGGSFPQKSRITHMAMRPSARGTLFVATEKGFFGTADGGQTWHEIENDLPRYYVGPIVINPSSPDVMWVGTSGAGVYKSTDGGKSWAAANNGLAASWIEKVWGNASGTIFAETTIGLYRTDGKGGWIEVLQPFSDDKANPNAIVFDAKNPNVVHAGDRWTYFRSSDGGATWSLIVRTNQEPQPDFDSLVIDEKNPKILYAAHPSSDSPPVFKSIDGGLKWRAASNRGLTGGVHSLRADSAGALLALGTKGLWRSVDGATTWTAIGNGLPAEGMKEFAIDPANPARMYVLSKDALYRSEDGGASFSESYKGKKDVETEGMAVDAKGNVYVGTREGVLRSSDGGKTWSAFNDGLANNDVRALFCAGTRLYAGTAAGGVFSIDLQ